MRRLLFLIAIAAAIGVPYLFQADGANLWEKVQELIPSASSHSQSSSATPHSLLPPTAGEDQDWSASHSGATALLPGEQPSGLATNVSLRDVLDFNITPQWVTHHWSDVSTATAEINLRGLRVSLVTGTKPTDVVGSLTFYFDNQERLQRVVLDGHTGDPAQLVQLVTRYHGFRPERSLDAGLYTKRWNGQPTGMLWLAHPRRVRSGAVNSQFLLKLEINRTDGRYRLSDASADFMRFRAQPQRW